MGEREERGVETWKNPVQDQTQVSRVQQHTFTHYTTVLTISQQLLRCIYIVSWFISTLLSRKQVFYLLQ